MSYDAYDAIRTILLAIGEDPAREGLRETPGRVVRSWNRLFEGYLMDPAVICKDFDGEDYDEMVLMRNIEFFSTCEHHMLPFTGIAHIAYIPTERGRVLGASKLPRLLDVFARRLQIQERICVQVTTAINDNIPNRGAACILIAKHDCMMCRGVEKMGVEMVTSSLKGAFKEDPATRMELMMAINMRLL